MFPALFASLGIVFLFLAALSAIPYSVPPEPGRQQAKPASVWTGFFLYAGLGFFFLGYAVLPMWGAR